MSKQQRHEQKKREKARRHPTSHIKYGVQALAAAAVIAVGTQAYASPVRFDNPAGGGHFVWFGPSGADPIALDIMASAADQTGIAGGANTFAQRNLDPVDLVGDGSLAQDLQVAGSPEILLVGVGAGETIPSGFTWNAPTYAYHVSFGSLLPVGEATYLGVRFDIGSGYQYGWIGVEMDGATYELDAFAWGYETEVGVSVPAGAPEPGTLALLAIGAGALLRRRR